MKIIIPAFKVCEEVIDFLHHYAKGVIDEKKIIDAIGKTPSYTKKSIEFLESLDIIHINNGSYSLSPEVITELNSNSPVSVIIKKGISRHSIFKEYHQLLNKGKSEKQASKFIISNSEITIGFETLVKTFEAWTEYLQKPDTTRNGDKKVDDPNSFMWIDDNGHLIYDQKSHSDFIVEQLKGEKGEIGNGSVFVDLQRIDDLKAIKSTNFDLSKLIRKCEELNIAYSTECYFAVAMLTRALIDHIPPVFGKSNFSEVTGGYGTRSFKDSMIHLDKSSRKISDSMLHTQIRRKEILPTKTQVNFSSDVDVLLAEVIRILK